MLEIEDDFGEIFPNKLQALFVNDVEFSFPLRIPL